VTARCEITQMLLGECAGACCKPELRMYKPVPEVWMRAASVQPIPPSSADVRRGNVHALFQVIGGRRGKPDVVDMARELCEPSSHREMYRPEVSAGRKAIKHHQPRYHVTLTPSLLVQLDESVAASASAGAGTSRPAESRPTANLDAIDTAGLIETEAGIWLRYLGSKDPLDVTGRVRRLASLIPSLEHCHRSHPLREDGLVLCCKAHQIEVLITRWWVQARVITGWDTPAFEPNNTCPLCGVRGRLRVRFLEQLAFCLHCRESWDETTIGLLADHIRHENREDEEAS
jgi:hypothetical protein